MSHCVTYICVVLPMTNGCARPVRTISDNHYKQIIYIKAALGHLCHPFIYDIYLCLGYVFVDIISMLYIQCLK